MADALCGPSNSVQAFRKQAGLDRTLQQDRLVHRGDNLESFRDAANHATSLDAQFEAFHNRAPFGVVPLQNVNDPIFNQDSPSRLGEQSLNSRPAQSSWIAEFSRLHLAQTSNLHSTGLSFESAPNQFRQGTIPGHYKDIPETRRHIRDSTFTSYQNANYFSAATPAPWNGPSSVSRAQIAPDATFNFDETAFQAAFDAAEEQSSLQQPHSIPGDHGQLALLQYNLLANVAEPTEQNIHRAALFMSLLEQYDQNGFDSGEIATLDAILSYVEENPRAVSYFARYDLQERAARYRQGCLGSSRAPSLELEPLQASLLQCVKDCMKAHVDQPMHDLDARATVATDPEMQADLAMQLQRLNKLREQDRVLQAISDNLTTVSDSSIRTALGTVWQSERQLLQNIPGALQRLDAQLQALPPQVQHAFGPMLERPITRSSIRATPPTVLDQQINQSQPTAQQQDELAQTASELLDKVAHNKSEKFKNSTFLDLMRKLKDREVQVEGDQMVVKDPSAHAEAAHASPTQFSVGATTLPRTMTGNAVPQAAKYHSTTGNQSTDGQAVIDLLNAPSFQPVDTGPSDSSVGRLYDELHGDLSRGLFDA